MVGVYESRRRGNKAAVMSFLINGMLEKARRDLHQNKARALLRGMKPPRKISEFKSPHLTSLLSAADAVNYHATFKNIQEVLSLINISFNFHHPNCCSLQAILARMP